MDFNEMKEQILQDKNDQFTQEDIEANKAIAAVGCIPILFWIPLVAKPDSAFGKFYANQGLILLICEVVLSILSTILGKILAYIPFIGGLLGGLLVTVISLVQLAAFLLLLISALQGKARELPFVGGLFTAFK